MAIEAALYSLKRTAIINLATSCEQSQDTGVEKSLDAALVALNVFG